MLVKPYENLAGYPSISVYRSLYLGDQQYLKSSTGINKYILNLLLYFSEYISEYLWADNLSFKQNIPFLTDHPNGNDYLKSTIIEHHSLSTH